MVSEIPPLFERKFKAAEYLYADQGDLGAEHEGFQYADTEAEEAMLNDPSDPYQVIYNTIILGRPYI